ncbi:DUF929 family protein [Ktedonospora formicarum]|uniref:DUF929 domain-containing protein n=1 Tax=Ktedonospora formicarum TaxID=2778364 RepID=A0A8J3HZ37_9CHLR|nr:DUF929 family protein [Ktedonospora formicarum]GHO43158.1 hypothetical protein KSX_13210 [Ktedonospora formicarum]
MANSKQRNSAAQRREQVRQQRNQRLNTNQKRRSRGRRGQRNNQPWLLVGGILVMVAVVIGIFVWASRQQSADVVKGSADAQAALTSLSPQTYKTVGAGNAKTLFKEVPPGTSIPKGPTGKPQLLYVGADWCPYCAAQRWSIVAALSRFGSFGGKIDTISSAEQNIITFSFHGAKYTSPYIDFVAIETQDNNGKTLDTPSAEQRSLIDTYDAPPYTSPSDKGAIPFMLVGNVATSSGSFFPPQTLLNLSYADVANDLKNPNSDVTKGIVGGANYLTAAICKATNNQPADVCTQEPIPTLSSSLFAKSSNPGSTALALNAVQMALPERRRY